MLWRGAGLEDVLELLVSISQLRLVVGGLRVRLVDGRDAVAGNYDVLLRLGVVHSRRRDVPQEIKKRGAHEDVLATRHDRLVPARRHR